MNNYQFRQGVRLPVKPNAVGAVIEELESRHGLVTPQEVVNVSRPVDAPLHPCFEWDDPRAAELYRRVQARHVVQCVEVVRGDTGAPKTYRAMVSITRADERGYVSLPVAMADPDMREQVLDEALTLLRGIEHRYGSIFELAGVFREAQRVAARRRRPKGNARRPQGAAEV